VEDALLEGQRRVDAAKLRTYWETGWFIKEHLLFNGDRAEYGAQVVQCLSGDLKIDRRSLYECLKFARLYPIVGRHPQLGWAHYRRFIQVADPVQRRELLAQTLQAGWTGEEVAARVVALNARVNAEARAPLHSPEKPQPLLTPKRGTPGVCRVIAVEGAPVVDLGFAVYRDLPTAQHKAGDFVRVDAAGRIVASPEATKADLFTYRTEMLKVVDGDTLWVRVYLQPEQWVKQKLRLRDLDCPEMDTAEGKAAKRFVEALMATATAIVISTTKPDKYDRYLADVFVTTADGDIYLNNELLSHGYAVRKGDYSPADWEES
jgi:endonuclease YncB( thermonuclease family)